MDSCSSEQVLLKVRAAVKETKLSGPATLKADLQKHKHTHTLRHGPSLNVHAQNNHPVYFTQTACLSLGGEPGQRAAGPPRWPPELQATGPPTCGSAGPGPGLEGSIKVQSDHRTFLHSSDHVGGVAST